MAEATLLPGFEERFAQEGGVRARYFVAGAGPPVVLVHGLGGSAANWTELAPLLAGGRRVLALDLPGHGRSDPLPELRDIGSLADHVASVAARETMLPAPVVGNSLGGLIGLRLAARRPDAVSALVLVATAGITSATTRAEIALAVASTVSGAGRAARIRERVARSPTLARAVFGYWGAADPAALSPGAVLGFLEGPAHARDVVTAARALARDDPRAELDRVRCPTLLVWGARDRVVPLADGFEYARRLRSPIRTVAAAGHLLVGERPEECAAIIEEFLDRHTAA